MTNKKTFFALLLAAVMCVPMNLNAQVTIGSGRAPSQWSLLDLCTDYQRKALHNARMNEAQRDALMNPTRPPAEQLAARGLMIFRTDAIEIRPNEYVGCLEFWNGITWISLCEDRVCHPITDITLSHTEEIHFDYSTHISTAVTLSVSYNGTEPFRYQWFSSTSTSNAGGTPIANATGSSFTTPHNLPMGVHFFFIEMENCDGIVRSEVFTVRVHCPGLWIPGGAFRERTGIVVLSGNATAPGTSSYTQSPAIQAVITQGNFERSGGCLCIYYRDFINTDHPHGSNTIFWNDLTVNGTNMHAVCGDDSGRGVDAIHAHPDWRLPNIAELAQIGQLVRNNPSSNDNTLIGGPILTQAMVNDRIGANINNGPLPTGTTVSTATPMLNLLHSNYWSSTRAPNDNAWSWNYTVRHAVSLGTVSHPTRVRCVREFTGTPQP